MARAIEVPVVAKKGTLARSIEGEAATAFRNLGRSSGAVAPLGRMLGKIRADADEFTKSIEASNARVIAFGASVGVINGISNAFKELVRVTVSVEKSLTDINVVLNANQSQLTKFGDGLFKVAKNTAQSFDVVAEAATEFARQGLSIEETLRRTNDALVLTRLTGIKAADAVKGLTAATNGFAKAGLTTTEIINKLAAVDVKFAVSADGLVEALKRTGAVAMDAGLSFDELIGMVTAAQQTTARGEAVIGNAFKTIFTRVQRPETLRTLRELKIAVEDASGAALPATQVLQNLANSYDGLSRSAKDAITQQVAGVFQINILKAAVSDLQKQNSIAARATAVSASATDEAAKKNEMLNQTIAALTTQTGLALTELAKKIGDIALAPGMRDLVGSFKALVEGTTGVLDGEGTGSTFARGLLKGIGNVLTGPGLIVIGGVFIKLFKDLTVFGMNSLKNLLGLNNAAKQQAALQQGIGTLLQTNTAYQTQIAAAAGNVNKQAAITQRFLQQEITLRQQAAALTGGMAGAAFMGGFRVDKAGDVVKKKRGLRGMVPGLAPTEVPSFSAGAFARFMPKRAARGTKLTGGTSTMGFHTGSMAGTGTAELSITGKQFRGAFKKSPGMEEVIRQLSAAGVAGVRMNVPYAGLTTNQQRDMIAQMMRSLRANPIPGFDHKAILGNLPKQGDVMDIVHSRLYGSGALARPGAVGTFNERVGGPISEAYLGRQFGAERMVGGNSIFDAMGAGGAMEMKRRVSEGTIASFMKKQILSEKNPALRNNLRELIRSNNIRVNGVSGEQIFDQYLQTAYASQYGALSGQGIIPKGLDPIRAVKDYHAAINFAPIGDAIKREKHQVGGLLGINPSQVKTKVIQNTALRSSFNPGGFGVISPTIGQNNFADARRMHKGEDLRTANLPNFMTPLPVSGISPKRPALSMTPVGYSEVIKTTIHGVTPEASKTLGAGVAKSITTEVKKLTPPAPMSRGVTIPPTSLTTNIKALDTLAKPGAGRLGNFGMNAFMAYTAGTMAGGFAPQAEQMFGLRQGQGEGALTGAALGGFAGMKAGAALGSMLAPGAGTIIGGAIGLGAGAYGGGYLGAAGLGNTFESARSVGNVLTGTGEFMYPDEIAFEKAQMTEFFGSQSAAEADEYLQALKDTRLNNKLNQRTSDIARAGEQARLSRDIQAGRMGGFGGFRALERQQRIDRGRRASKQGVQETETNAAQAEKFIRDIEKVIPAGTGGILGAQLKNQLRAMAAVGDFQGIQNIFESMRAENQPVISGEMAGGIPKEFYGGTAPPEVADAFRGDISLSAPRRVGPTGAQAIFMKETPLEKAMRANMSQIDPEVINRGITDNPEFADAITERGGVTAQSVMELNTKLTEITRTNTEFVDGLREATLAQKEMADSFDYENKIEQTREALAKLNEQMKHVDRVTQTATSSLGNAFSAITTGSSSAGDAFSNMAISILGEINKINNQFIASEIMSFLPTTGLFKALTPTPKNKAFDIDVAMQQKGGLIKAQNGMYISGGRTGDKNPALLEDGEYVLNRNAVKALGGPSAIDGLNFGVAPRFQSGGRLASPVAGAGVRSSSLNKIIEENEFLPPMAGMGTALGGGGSSVRLGITDPRLSGFAHANDPVLQNVRADVQKYHERRRQKKFESQAKKDSLIQMIVGTVVGAGVAKGVGALKGKFQAAKLKRQQDFTSGVMGMDTGPGFIGPMNQAASAPSAIAGAGAGFGSMGSEAAKAFGFAGPVTPPGEYGQLADAMQFKNLGLRDAMLAVGLDTTGDRSSSNPEHRGKGVYGMGQDIRKQIINIFKRAGQPAPKRISPLLQRHMSPRALRELDMINFGTTGEPVRPYPGRQSGGYIDNIPAMLTGGEFVVNPSTVRRHGSAFFSKLNRGGRIGYQTGGLVGDQQFVPAQGDTQNNNKTETSNNNATSSTTVNITVNTGTGETNVDGGNAGTEDREMATRLRDAVLSVLKQEKRTGGMLRDVTSNDQ